MVVAKESCGHCWGLHRPGGACNPGSKTCAARVVRAGLATLLGFLVLLLFVRAACASAPPPGSGDTFPTECYPNFGGRVPVDCTRVALPQGDPEYAQGIAAAAGPGGLVAARVPAAALTAAARRWAESVPQSLTDAHGAGLTHTVALTGLFGFIDDLFTQVKCVSDGNGTSVAVLSAHFEQRLGSGDFGVNQRRMLDLRAFVLAQSLSLPAGDCAEALP